MDQEDLIGEIRALRQDLRRHVRHSLFVVAGAVILVCVVFGMERDDAMEVGQVAVAGGLLLGTLWLVALVFQAIFRALARRRNQRESFAILSGRSRVSQRR